MIPNGYYRKTIRVKSDAIPIDNISKFAWDDTDYEEVEEFVEYTEEELAENKKREDSALENIVSEQDEAICTLYEESLKLKSLFSDVDEAICYLYEKTLEDEHGNQSNS